MACRLLGFTAKMASELWIPRTLWEKRRQISAMVHRSMVTGRRVMILSCDDWTTFFGRLDVSSEEVTTALTEGKIEYTQLAPLGTDLSQVLGQAGARLQERGIRQVVVDDVDLLIDLASEEAAAASIFALVYALIARFEDIALFCNPLRSEQQIHYLMQLGDFLVIHHPPVQSAA